MFVLAVKVFACCELRSSLIGGEMQVDKAGTETGEKAGEKKAGEKAGKWATIEDKKEQR